MPSFLGALLSLLFTLPAFAHVVCDETEAEVRACVDSWQIERTKLLPSTAMVAPGDDWLTSANYLASFMRDAEARFLSCVGHFERYQTSCQQRSLATAVNWSVAIVQRTVTHNDVINKLNYMISAANSRAGAERFALTCFRHAGPYYNFPICFVVDRKDSTYAYRDVVDADDLPVRVGASEDCSFYVDDANRILTADHCGQAHLERGWPFDRQLGEVVGDFRMSLPQVIDNYAEGRPFEDLALFNVLSPLRPIGKTVTHLALDETMTSGDCEMRPGGILACSERALEGLNSKKAEILSFPAAVYIGTQGDRRRERPLSVLQTRGPLTYEPRMRRFYVHAYSSWGSSGAPAYLPAGVEVGGIMLSRPLILGVVSAFRGAKPSSGISDDVMSVVSVPQYRRLALLLAEPRAVYAIGTDR